MKKRTRICKKHINIKRIVVEDGTTRCPECLIKKNERIIHSCVNKAKKKHGDLYDYSLVNFKNIQEKVKIICKTHGVFEQHIYNHIKGNKCPKCAREAKLTSIQEVLKKFNEIHDREYNYSLVKYKNNKTKVKIICKKHGVFEQAPEKHLTGQGCPVCRISHGEREIRKFLIDNKIKFERQKIFDGCINPKSKRRLRFDFFLIDLNVCLEYDGEQHFSKRFLKNSEFDRLKINDELKNEFCKKEKIRILRIDFTQFKKINEILKEKILCS